MCCVLIDAHPSFCPHQVVEHLESDLGVQVQRVSIHKMKYSFQIWSAMMSSQDSDGTVGDTWGHGEGAAGGGEWGHVVGEGT